MRLKTIDLRSVKIRDDFWDKYTNLVTDEVLPYQWQVLNDERDDVEPSHAIRNFRIAAGKEEGDFYGFVFQDSDVAKWLEAAAYSLAWKPDDKLEQRADDVIRLLSEAQRPDGYLDTYFIIRDPEHTFANLREGHELYCAGHLIEAGTAYYKVTGKRALLDICIRMADHIIDVFHTSEMERAIPGHEEIELALVKLYEVTGKDAYLEMAAEFLDRRGRAPHYFFEEMRRPHWKQIFGDQTGEGYHLDYAQTDQPVRDQRKAEGHAVRAVYLYCAMADVAAYKQDPSLLEACERLYENITRRQMYITGGIGSSGHLERFTTDYDLPNAMNYAESCASIGLALFCRRMAQLTKNGKYMDTAETALYNTVLAGIAMDGKSFFYVNPLAVWPAVCMSGTSRAHVKPVRQGWFSCACCPPNIARTLASLGEYCFFEDEEGFWVNLFVAGTSCQKIGGTRFTVETETDFPFGGSVRMTLHGEEKEKQEASGTVRIRIPGYVKTFSLLHNGTPVRMDTEKEAPLQAILKNGYVHLRGSFHDGDVLELGLEIPARFYYANPEVRADAGRAALKKGPLVYCLEQEDNGENLEQLMIDSEAVVEEIQREDILKGTLTLKAKGYRTVLMKNEVPEKERETNPAENEEDVLYSEGKLTRVPAELTFVPYAYWGNRKPGEMIVWVRTLIR